MVAEMNSEDGDTKEKTSKKMDSDFWTARLAAAKRQFNLQHHNLHGSSHLDRLNMDDFEVEDEVRPDIPCPYCYEDFDIASLCAHLEDEHSCESRTTVCPICSVKVVRDMLSHIRLQHGQLFKFQRRRRLRRVAIPSSQALSLLGRDLREAHLQVLLGGGGFRSGSNVPVLAAANDPFLSSLVMNFSGPEVDDFSKTVASTVEDSTCKSTLTKHHRKPRYISNFDAPNLWNCRIFCRPYLYSFKLTKPGDERKWRVRG